MRKRYTANQKAQIVLEVLKEERTIAGLAGCEAFGPRHLAEALQHRPRILSN